jgi:hypothetical protein
VLAREPDKRRVAPHPRVRCGLATRVADGWLHLEAQDRRYDDRQSGGNVVFFHGIKIGAGATLASWATGAEHVEALGRHNGRPRVGGRCRSTEVAIVGTSYENGF